MQAERQAARPIQEKAKAKFTRKNGFIPKLKRVRAVRFGLKRNDRRPRVETLTHFGGLLYQGRVRLRPKHFSYGARGARRQVSKYFGQFPK
jgi:hypothetical protein